MYQSPTKEEMQKVVDQNRFAAGPIRTKDMAGLVDGPFQQIFAKTKAQAE